MTDTEMTDQQRFEEWWAENSRKAPKDRYGCYVTPSEIDIFLAALAIGERKGMERAAEIVKNVLPHSTLVDAIREEAERL
jgi:hypothetical protein